MHSKGSRLTLLVLTFAGRHECLVAVTSNTDVFTHRIRVGQHLPNLTQMISCGIKPANILHFTGNEFNKFSSVLTTEVLNLWISDVIPETAHIMLDDGDETKDS